MIKEEEDPIAFAAHRLASAYEIGQAVDDLSVEEIGLRIDMLTREVRRLEETRQAKEACRASAAAFFKI